MPALRRKRQVGLYEDVWDYIEREILVTKKKNNRLTKILHSK